jgi:tetratricopeptide (TPR) repeat protein
LRAQLRAALAGQQIESLDELKRFYAAHRQKDANAELTQYISFGLSLEGPPGFKFRVPLGELPPDVFKMQGLEQILPRFYKEAKLEQFWQRAQPDYDKVISDYHGPISRTLLQANAYLRNPTSGYLGRRFQIYIELLAAPNQVQTRNYKDDYFVVITPTPEIPIQPVEYAYLHYLLDPLSLKYSEQLDKLKSLSDYAQGAPALDDVYKNDFLLLATGSLIKAVESRLARGQQNREATVNQATREGFVLTPAFAEGLVAYEKQVEAMRLYFPDLVGGIDLRHEVQRLEKVQFATERTRTKIATAPAPVEPKLTGAAKTLEQADGLYRSRDLDRAKQSYLRVLEETTQKTLHAEAYYGLARIAALQKDPELAQKLFQRSLELGPEPETKGWVYVYLGRLAVAAGEPGEAAQHYRAVLAIAGASPAARAAAQKELEKSGNHN